MDEVTRSTSYSIRRELGYKLDSIAIALDFTIGVFSFGGSVICINALALATAISCVCSLGGHGICIQSATGVTLAGATHWGGVGGTSQDGKSNSSVSKLDRAEKMSLVAQSCTLGLLKGGFGSDCLGNTVGANGTVMSGCDCAS
jgi:hypothetical protein